MSCRDVSSNELQPDFSITIGIFLLFDRSKKLGKAPTDLFSEKISVPFCVYRIEDTLRQ